MGSVLGVTAILDPVGGKPEQFQAAGVEPVGSAEELYKRSQYVSLHVPATAETKGSIGKKLLELGVEAKPDHPSRDQSRCCLVRPRRGPNIRSRRNECHDVNPNS